MPADSLLNGQLGNIVNGITATGALGTAAYGLVDTTKVFGGGVSRAGLGDISAAVDPFILGFSQSAFGKAQILETLRANWLNGMAKGDQKAVAKSLIRLSLTPENARPLALATALDADRLTATIERIHAGEVLTPQDLNIIGQFDAVVSARLDAGYERADQRYRNTAKALSALVAIVLAVVAGALIFFARDPAKMIGDYLGSSTLLLAILVGAISTPLAPIAKDLSTALVSAVGAVSSARRR